MIRPVRTELSPVPTPFPLRGGQPRSSSDGKTQLWTHIYVRPMTISLAPYSFFIRVENIVLLISTRPPPKCFQDLQDAIPHRIVK